MNATAFDLNIAQGILDHLFGQGTHEVTLCDNIRDDGAENPVGGLLINDGDLSILFGAESYVVESYDEDDPDSPVEIGSGGTLGEALRLVARYLHDAQVDAYLESQYSEPHQITEDLAAKYENTDLACPDVGLDRHGFRAWVTIIELLQERDDTYTGGSRGFYSPVQWEQKGEDPIPGAVLIVGHDGGSIAPYFNDLYENDDCLAAMRVALEGQGLVGYKQGSWYSAVFLKQD